MTDDANVHGEIERLVAEEHELWEREAGGSATESDRHRLDDVRVALDRCWDLLRQRGRSARRAATPTVPRCGARRSSRSTCSS
jgi:Protein of unknown function (DUF2630)